VDADRDALSLLLRDAAMLDGLAEGRRCEADPAVALLAALRAEVDTGLSVVANVAVARDARLLDLVAAGNPVPAAADGAAALLAALRTHVDALPNPAVASGADTVGRVGRRGRLGQRRAARAAVLAMGFAGVLSTSGVAAAAFSSHPGATLYPLRAAVFGRTDDDPEVARELLRQARDAYDLAEESPGQVAAQHYAESSALLQQAQRLVPGITDSRALPVLEADASGLRARLEQVPVAVPRPASSIAVVAAPSPGLRPTAAAASPAAPGRAPAPALLAAAPAPVPAGTVASGAVTVTASSTASTGGAATPESSLSPAASPDADATEASGTANPLPSESAGTGTPAPVGSEAQTPAPSVSGSTSASPLVTTTTSARPSATGTVRPSVGTVIRSASSSPSRKTARPTRKPVRRTALSPMADLGAFALRFPDAPQPEPQPTDGP